MAFVDSDAGIALELPAMARIRNDPPTKLLRTLRAQAEWIDPQFHALQVAIRTYRERQLYADSGRH